MPTNTNAFDDAPLLATYRTTRAKSGHGPSQGFEGVGVISVTSDDEVANADYAVGLLHAVIASDFRFAVRRCQRVSSLSKVL